MNIANVHKRKSEIKDICAGFVQVSESILFSQTTCVGISTVMSIINAAIKVYSLKDPKYKDNACIYTQFYEYCKLIYLHSKFFSLIAYDQGSLDGKHVQNLLIRHVSQTKKFLRFMPYLPRSYGLQKV